MREREGEQNSQIIYSFKIDTFADFCNTARCFHRCAIKRSMLGTDIYGNVAGKRKEIPELISYWCAFTIVGGVVVHEQYQNPIIEGFDPFGLGFLANQSLWLPCTYKSTFVVLNIREKTHFCTNACPDR